MGAVLLGTGPNSLGANLDEQGLEFECPCSVSSDGTTISVTFGLRNFSDYDHADPIVIVDIREDYQEFGRVFLSDYVPAGDSLDSATYEIDHYPASGRESTTIVLLLHTHGTWPEVHDRVSMATTGDTYGAFEVDWIDYLEDTDGDRVGDVNEGIAGTDPEDAESTPGDSTVDVVVLYEKKIADRYDGDPTARIQQMFAYANAALADGDVPMRYRAVGAEQLTSKDDEQRGFPTIESMHEVGTRHGADWVAYLLAARPELRYCGSVQLNGFIGHGHYEPRVERWLAGALMNVIDDCADHTLAHELGHLMGLGHAVDQRQTGLWRTGRGYRIDGDFHTVMAYQIGDSLRLPAMSSPDLVCRGNDGVDRPCGVAHEESDGADARRALDLTRFQVAAFREGFPDRDGDGFVDPVDGFPDDPNEWWDMDRDGIPDRDDEDIDGDGVGNDEDPFPRDGSEWADNDGDGDGDNGDEDDDEDGIADAADPLPFDVARPDRRLLLVPPASDWDSDKQRQGFVAVVNLSARAGEVRMGATDDMGVSTMVTLHVGANETVYFNSADLEAGSPGKGLAEGVGSGEGDWRLEFASELDIEVLAYIRTRDGFLTAMHDAVGRFDDNSHRVPFFNPGSNTTQVSLLRLVNPRSEAAGVSIRGIDGNGVSPGAGVRVAIPPGHGRTLSAAQLEHGDPSFEGSLGDGKGKWRLVVDSDVPIQVMSLLESPKGHLTNLSTAPSTIRDDAHVVALFPAAGDPDGRQGFVQVVNATDRSGDVEIMAVDDTGSRFGPVTLALDANATTHFNSDDLEGGNDDKGLSGGVGDGDGDWWLELTSESGIEVMSYIRTVDGFVTAMHDTATRVDTRHWIPTFNPGSNNNQVSRLRLVNPAEETAEVTIRGIDANGDSPGGVVDFSVPASATRTFTAAQLESGDHALDGMLGDGIGKWRLIVESDQPIIAVNVLQDPAGLLTNLSTPGPGTAARSFSDTLADGSPGPEMVGILPGSYRMGCVPGGNLFCPRHQAPAHAVSITHGFALSKHEVSFAQWDACVADGGCRNDVEDNGWGRGDRPVIDVSWRDAQAYATWLSEQTGEDYRLPNEAEWEYAARASSATEFHWGERAGWAIMNSLSTVPRLHRRTQPVGSYQPNAWGLYNVHGNVAEWVEDCWNANYEGAPADGGAWLRGRCSERVARGGSWYDDQQFTQSRARTSYSRNDQRNWLGFRLARDVDH